MNEYRKERELGIFHKKFTNLFPHVHIAGDDYLRVLICMTSCVER